MLKHNIIAEFSTSLNEDGSFKQYQVVADSTFSDEYNETLDTATILLNHIPAKDRLSKIKAYQYVRIFDKNSWNGTKYTFDVVMIIDNYNETEINVCEHIFSYSINLMSETKLLEKWQCPNVKIDHKINTDGSISKKAIYQYICQYMELYVPKVKWSDDGQNWYYKPLIEIPGTKTKTVFIYDNVLNEDYKSGNIEINNQSNRFFSITNGKTESVSFIEIQTVNNFVIKNKTENTLTIPAGWKYMKQGALQELASDIILYPQQEAIIASGGIFSILSGQNFKVDAGLIVTNENTYVPRTQDMTLYNKFNVNCVDMAMSCPTLRQLLTSLMQQVGCIPTIKNHKLSFLDFNADADAFGGEKGMYVNGTVSTIHKSLSSDSYANTLVNVCDNVLDTESEVYSETIGFRDTQNVVLKQKENLTLETRFPIYKINEAKLRIPVVLEDMPFISTWQYQWDIKNSLNPSINKRIQIKAVTSESGGYVNNAIEITMAKSLVAETLTDPNTGIEFTSKGSTWRLKIEKIHCGNIVLEDGKYKFIEKTVIRQSNVISISPRTNPLNAQPQSFYDCVMVYNLLNTDDATVVLYTDQDNLTTCNFMWLEADITPVVFWEENGSIFYKEYPHLIPAYLNESAVIGYYSGTSVISGLKSKGYLTIDTTPIFVERSVRSLLDKDFVKMRTAKTLTELATYVYGTVGYSVGSNKISGFSEVFGKGTQTIAGWFKLDYTYIENIVNFIIKKDINSGIDGKHIIYNGENGGFVENLPVIKENFFCNLFKSGVSIMLKNYSYLTFDIKYLPLNSFNNSFVKEEEDIDFPIEQYDGSASGISEYDRLSVSEQEKVNRIGNETLNITQRTENYNDIQSLPSYFCDDIDREDGLEDEEEDEKHIIFKRTFTVGNYMYNVSYVGSKAAILKNYFTSIRTKYRAYQYVDYSQSALRKEKDVIFVRLGADYYEGDDKIMFFSPYDNNLNKEKFKNQKTFMFINGIFENKKPEYNITIVYEKSIEQNEAFKNEISAYSNHNSWSLTYRDFDNASFGLSLIPDSNKTTNIGGVVQDWNLFPDDYYERNKNFYCNANTLNEMLMSNIVVETENEFYNIYLENTYSSPLNKLATKTIWNNKNSYIFAVCDNNNASLSSSDKEIANSRTYYKENGEVLNKTVQFIYYTTSKNIKWSKNFISNNGFIRKDNSSLSNVICSVDNWNKNLSKEEIVAPETRILSQNVEDFISYNEGDTTRPYLLIKWHSIPSSIEQFAVSSYKNGVFKDFIAFKRPKTGSNEYDNSGNVKIYVTLNDTKTDYVLSEKNGIIYRRYKVDTNTANRTVTSIYNEEQAGE